MLRDDVLADAIEADWTTADLSPRRVAMLRYVVKLTNEPESMHRSDVDALHSVGFADRDVLDIAEVTAYYAYANRIADGLGVELEPWADF